MENVTRNELIALAILVIIVIAGIWLGAIGAFTICIDCNNPPLHGT